MCIKRNRDIVQELNKIFSEKGNLYILGAGVSAKIIPSDEKIAEDILHYKNIYNCVRAEIDDIVTQKVLLEQVRRNPNIVWNNFDRAVVLNRTEKTARILAKVPNEAVHAVHLDKVIINANDIPLPEYEVFRAFPRTTVATTNYDGLANQYCQHFGHKVLNLHGSPPIIKNRTEWVRLSKNCYSNWHSRMPIIEAIEKSLGLLLPQPENEDILNTEVYIEFETILLKAKRLIIIGYSFGNMDDYYTFQMIANILKYNQIPVYVIDQNEDSMKKVVDAIQAETRSPDVHGIVESWGSLSTEIMKSHNHHICAANFYRE